MTIAIKAAGDEIPPSNCCIELTTEGLDLLLVACSELFIINDSLPYGIPVVNTIDVLAEAVIVFSRDGLTGTVKMGTEKTATNGRLT